VANCWLLSAKRTAASGCSADQARCCRRANRQPAKRWVAEPSATTAERAREREREKERRVCESERGCARL